jgi:hypothetical protein
MRSQLSLVLLGSVCWLCGPSCLPAADSLEDALQQISQIEPTDAPNSVAEAWKIVSQADVQQLPQVLASIQGSNPLAANWLRAAADAMAQRALSEQQSLPIAELEQFVSQTRHDPRARRLAFEWLQKAEPKLAASLIPNMLQDPSVELRRESVALRMVSAEKSESSGAKEAAIVDYQQALNGARDEDQVKEIAKRLRALDQPIDLPRHFGFLQNWHLIAPFDNTERAGIDVVYPPETTIDLSAEYPGKDGTARWQKFTGQDDFGMIDLNKPFGAVKNVVGYAWTEFQSDKSQKVDLRLGCKNAWKVWVNGELLFSRNEYHRGMQMDQYRLQATLKPGPNQILVKLCQNEQTESWTVEWQFQLRVCDATGTAILSQDRQAP